MFKDASWHLFPVAAGGTRGVAVPLGQHQELSAVTWALSPLRCAGALSQQWPGHQSGDASAVRCVWLGTPGDTWGARDGQGRAQQGPGPGSWPRERSQFSWQIAVSFHPLPCGTLVTARGDVGSVPCRATPACSCWTFSKNNTQVVSSPLWG